jgi:hypothetical protein
MPAGTLRETSSLSNLPRNEVGAIFAEPGDVVKTNGDHADRFAAELSNVSTGAVLGGGG